MAELTSADTDSPAHLAFAPRIDHFGRMFPNVPELPRTALDAAAAPGNPGELSTIAGQVTRLLLASTAPEEGI